MKSKELTIGKVIDSLEKEIFTSVDEKSKFKKNCQEREKGLKQAINICMNQVVELAEAPGLDSLTNRQKIKSDICLENLSKYADELIAELDKEKIETHCHELENKAGKSLGFFNQPFYLDLIFLITNSFHIAISTNILWAPDVTVAQAVEISKGKLNLNELGKHLPVVLKRIKKDVLPYLKKSSLLSEFHPNITEAVECYKKKLNRGCSLITMTSIEGIVRKLATFLASPHELGSDFKEEKYNSLNQLLRDVNWKKDLEIESTQLSLILGESRTKKERQQHYLNDDIINVDLNTRLDFLKGRFKDDRDLILHGSQQNYNQDWNLYLNFSALYETINVCKIYESKYGS
ncbi:hypothetical protein HNS38_19915 [Lentimicrobium sp. L6]|uniref:hypothetical protein n=1 Tax=Lentimicrobium sp. L6 TaxID=2735916 RepID=UPI001555A694|nr:hypothetical protein [Lentimicrobium sp. L6]NPD87025.1 hypothetical protein [Lentimicrobium sp. L6]